MKKNEMITRIIGSVMEEKGFELYTDKKTNWEWRKVISGVEETVSVWDSGGWLNMSIGGYNGYYMRHTLDHPRTKGFWTWDDNRDKEKSKAMYEDILYDMRDIIIKNCDGKLQEDVELKKKALPNKRHYEKLINEFDQLVEEYSEKCGTENKTIMEILDIIMFRISRMFYEPLEEVEDDLVGFAAVMYFEMQRQYEGEIKVIKTESRFILEVGQYRSFSFLGEMFRIWRNPEVFNDYRNDFIKRYQGKKRNV